MLRPNQPLLSGLKGLGSQLLGEFYIIYVIVLINLMLRNPFHVIVFREN